jgi:hypothetical protein
MSTTTQSPSPTTIDHTGQEILPMISNLNVHMDELHAISGRNAYFALNAVCNTLGYSIVNQMLWKNRKEQQRMSVDAPTIDIFNDEAAEAMDIESARGFAGDLGFTTLPEFNAIPLTGAYKRILQLQRADFTLSKDFPATMPHEILHRLQQPQEQGVNDEYVKFMEKEIESSAAADAIKNAVKALGTKLDEREQAKKNNENDIVLKQIQGYLSEQLSDELWEGIPQYMQYRLVFPIYKQAIKALAFLIAKDKKPDAAVSRLLKLIDTITLELQGAARTEELKMAFDMERMGSAENLNVVVAEPEAAEVETVVKMVGNKRVHSKKVH